MLARYGSADCITGAKLDARVLQIDHRIPFRVAGDAGLVDRDVSAYMLLDASSQRARSWSCEQCRNFRELHDASVCKGCFWAFPEAYEHIAMQPIRRTDVVWQGVDVRVHDRLKTEADQAGITMAELLLQLARRRGQFPQYASTACRASPRSNRSTADVGSAKPSDIYMLDLGRPEYVRTA